MFIHSYYLQQLSFRQLKAPNFNEYGIVSDIAVVSIDSQHRPIKRERFNER